MSNWTFDLFFYALFFGALVLVILRLTHVLSQPAFAIVTLVLAGGLMLFFLVRGGVNAKTSALVVMLIGVLGAVPSFAPTRATADFYAAASQIIPILLLALALEVRLFQIRWPPQVARHTTETWLSHQRRQIEKDPSSFVTALVLLVTLFALVVGELHALNALAGPHPEREKPWTVYNAVAVGLIIVAFIALFGGLHDDQHEDTSTGG